MSFSSFIGRSQYRGDLIALSNKAKRAKEVKFVEDRKIRKLLEKVK
jgi:hypothetical protein